MDHDDHFQPPLRQTDPFSDHPGSDPRGIYNAPIHGNYPDPYASNVSLNADFAAPQLDVSPDEQEKLLYPDSVYPPK